VHSAASFANAQYERPAIQARLGDVRGESVLDAGCAGGEHTAHLVKAGADVIALDKSESMAALMRERFGSTVRVECHDLEQPLRWLVDESVDVVLCSLTMHYLKEWEPTMRDFYRVLRGGGRLLFSTHHPFFDLVDRECYFETVLIEEEWRICGVMRSVSFYHRPLAAIVSPVLAAGFRIDVLAEPNPERPEQPPFLIIEASK
jgi:SAM-dependent methyltransferase